MAVALWGSLPLLSNSAEACWTIRSSMFSFLVSRPSHFFHRTWLWPAVRLLGAPARFRRVTNDGLVIRHPCSQYWYRGFHHWLRCPHGAHKHLTRRCSQPLHRVRLHF